ncbi:cysteine-rich receptor-like protein kinase 2 [Phoenix dactylifera]|uniref:Cysteine-rich receptor-like protein kinase 2 n=1 Tax=Phoenix dactylifera TaxID=42345 RepID=A0A8B7C423_PHODC|nr:cysteine-rich receptor-like protein kinase 2 [Phoenix dactylifera]
MDSSCSLGTLIAVLIPIIIWKASLADPRTTVAGQFCNNISSVSGPALADNFVPAMDNLSSLVDRNGFGTTVAGTGPNSVYALGQCFGDLGSVDCQLCFSEIRSLLPKCYPEPGGRIFLDGCFGRYENYSFFNEVVDSNDTHVCSYSKNSSNPRSFSKVVQVVVSNVTSEALKKQGFAVGSASDSNSQVYALAQCWENLDETLCGSCLDAAASSIVLCSPATEGRALYAGCYLRYSTVLFWNLNQTASNSSGNHTNKVIWIILGVLLGGFLFIVGIVAWRKRGYWSKSNVISMRDMYKPELSAAFSQSNMNFRYEDLRKATNNFNLSNKLGQGSYGTVYKAVLSDGKGVAVKRLFMNTRQWVDQFFNEVELINRVRHKNLVKLLGCSVDGPESLLVYEYYSNRSLDLFIFDENHDKHLVWQQRLDIIQGVAEGLSYLHEESETRIIHRDIKASNILLDEKFMPKITDFGLARSFAADKTHLSTGIAGTLGYMAPEYVVYGHLTEKADVYSYGVLILEIVTGKRCSSGIGTHGGNLPLAKIWDHYKTGTAEKLIEECIYKESVKADILHIVWIGLFCVQANPHSRPTMAKVLELLRSSRNEEEVVLTDPPFSDVAMEDIEEGETSFLLPSISAPALSTSSECQINAR